MWTATSALCSGPNNSLVDDPSLIGEKAEGILGGGNNGTSWGSNYTPREIRARLVALAPCILDNSCDTWSGTLPSPGFDAQRANANQARITVSNDLAKHLDDKPQEGDFNRTGPTELDSWGGYARGEIALPAGIDFTTTSAYDTYDRKVDIDLDFSPETLFQIITNDEGWQFYQDLKLAGQVSDDRPIRWDVGAWFLRENLKVKVNNDFGELNSVGVVFRDYEQETYSAAGYATLAFDFWEDFTLDGGIRYNFERKEFDLFQIEGSDGMSREAVQDNWHDPTGTVRLTYRFREDTHAFWKYTRGWKPGTFNATAATRTGVTSAKPETIDSFEAGIRGAWFEGRLGLDAAIFFYAYENYQIFTAQQFLGGNPEFVILNASDAEVYGAEVDATGRPWNGAFVNIRFSWLESQFLDFQKTDQFLGRAGEDTVAFKQTQNSGNQLLNSPRFKVSITAEQTLFLGRYGQLTGRYDGVWTDDTYYDPSQGLGLGDRDGNTFLPSNTIGQEAYWLHNARLSWRSPGGNIEVAGWVRNIEDKAYKTFGFDGSTFRQTTIYFVGDPRTYGATVVVNF